MNVENSVQRNISHHWARWWEKYLSKRSPSKHTCSWRDNLIELWTVSRQAKIFLRISKMSVGSFYNQPNSQIGQFRKIQEEEKNFGDFSFYKLWSPCLTCTASKKGNYKLDDFHGKSLLLFLFVSDDFTSFGVFQFC